MEPNCTQIYLGTESASDTLWGITLNAKELMLRLRQAILDPDLVPKITRSRTAFRPFFFLAPFESTL